MTSMSKISCYMLLLLTLIIPLGAIHADEPAPPERPSLQEEIRERYEGTPESRQEGRIGLFSSAGYTSEVLEDMPLAFRIGVTIRTLMMLVGIVFLMYVVYSGIQWMIAGGNEEAVMKARTRIIRATVGLLIVVGAWILTTFILNAAFGRIGAQRTGARFGPIEVRTF